MTYSQTARFPAAEPEQSLSADLAMARVLHACCSASHEMQQKEYQAHNQGNVNETGGYVKCEKSKQPKNNQNYGDHRKRAFFS
jgi:hypothetical protein